MQPIHSREARWFWEWDRLELLRGIGLSLFIAGILFLAAALVISFFKLPPEISYALSGLGFLMAVLSYCLDALGKPHHERNVQCRKCRSAFKMIQVMENDWACKKCGTPGKFDNLV